jgi:hypothetical protein
MRRTERRCGFGDVSMLRHRKIKVRAAWALLLACLAAGPVSGTCYNPTGNETAIVYNSASHTYQFCNGINWMPFTGGGLCTPASAGYNPTTPSGSGYFVLTSGTYTGNLGGLSGADSTCLTELTTNTGWLGYSTANANGQLVASKVHAWMCNDYDCTDLVPLAKYYFANAGNGSAGGAYFTSNVDGFAPNDNANWSGTTYFDGSYSIWTGRIETLTETSYANAPVAGSDCSQWTTASSGTSGEYGISNSTVAARWGSGFGYGYQTNTCNTSYYLICFVNP